MRRTMEKDNGARAPMGELEGGDQSSPPEVCGGLLAMVIDSFEVEGTSGQRLLPINWPSNQIDACRRLVGWAQEQPGDPEDWCRRYLVTAARLKSAKRGVWERGKPWVPSVICSQRMLPLVADAIDEEGVSQTTLTAAAAYVAAKSRRSS